MTQVPDVVRWRFALLPWLVVWGSVWGCDQWAGIHPCGKECQSAKECGAGYECTAGRCAGAKCGAGAAPGDGSGSSQASHSGSGVSSGGSGSGAGQSSSGGSRASSARSSSLHPGDGGVDGGVDAGPPPPCETDGGTMPLGTPCGPHVFCNATGNCVPGCWMAPNLVQPGADPLNTCRRCDPSRNDHSWTANPPNTPCGQGTQACTQFKCSNAGACEEQPRCAVNVPTCVPQDGGVSCECTVAPQDSCAVALSNKKCVSGACGCLVNQDCAAGQFCGAAHTCHACNLTSACGSDCLACRDLPMSLGEASYYTCTGNFSAAATVCTPVACDGTSANCDGRDDNRCEINLSTNASHCSACGVVCPGPGAVCSGGQCACGTCPLNQTCSGNTCQCQQDSQCQADAGYHCSNHVCVR